MTYVLHCAILAILNILTLLLKRKGNKKSQNSINDEELVDEEANR